MKDRATWTPLKTGDELNSLKDTLMDVGFSYYLILARMLDIDPHLTTGGYL
jgi:hypothetical protein